MITHPLRQALWGSISKHTVETNQTNETNAIMHPLVQVVWRSIWKHTVENNQSKVTSEDYIQEKHMNWEYATYFQRFNRFSKLQKIYLSTISGRKNFVKPIFTEPSWPLTLTSLDKCQATLHMWIPWGKNPALMVLHLWANHCIIMNKGDNPKRSRPP